MDFSAVNQLFYSLLFLFSFTMLERAQAVDIEMLECPPPDYPEFGGYGPIQDFYVPGDSIHYFCSTATYIGGNYFRLCLDSGDWSGNTPVCDPAEIFEQVWQTSTKEPAHKNEAENANDGSRISCSATEPGPDTEWTANFKEVSQVIRIMLFLPKGDASYEIFVLRPDGSKYSCGGKEQRIERYEWAFHNCPEPHNTGMVSVKIKSKSAEIPLRLCEVVAHVITQPSCVDPHVPLESGRLVLSRKKAELECDKGYRKSREKTLLCIRTGIWQRKQMYCLDTGREVENTTRSDCNNRKK